MSKRGTEIERRFLLNHFPSINRNVKATSIEQGYIEMPSRLTSFRTRIRNGSSGLITLKKGKVADMVSRDEFEEPISLEMAQELFKECHYWLYKLRSIFEGWEIDVFESPLNGIVLAEKELSSPDEPVEIPDWLKPYIIREVTDSISNLHLARLASDLRGTESPALSHLDKHLKKIPRHVLTGGPCSGKSTIMDILKKEYPEFHFVPEVATIIIGQLSIFPGNDLVSQYRFQRAIYRTQKLFESTSTQYAISQNKEAIVFDRGGLDGAAYLPRGLSEFEKMIGITRDDEYGCYDSVICLSVPPREIYEAKKMNNPARSEPYEDASALGEKIHRAWRYHTSFQEVTTEDWEEKVQAVRNALK